MIEKRTALLVGASGLVGSHVLSELLASEKYSKVKAVTRSPLARKHNKLTNHILNFNKLELSSELKADDVYCCLGTTIKKAGSKEAFYQVDYTYPYEVARAALAQGAKRFAIVTAMGADSKSSIFYNRVKGDIEMALRQLDYETLLIFRPSLLLGERSETRVGEKIGEKLSQLFRPVIPAKYRAIEAQKVAKAMVSITSSNLKGILVYESDVLQEF
ncbi:MAG: oxidoreductase [Runella sp.]